jgi:integrase
MAQACDVYWKLHGSKKPTARNYKNVLAHFREFFQGRFVDTVTYLDVRDYRAHRGKVVSPSSVNREHTVLTHLFNALREWRRLKTIHAVRLPEENPGSLVRRVNEKQFRRTRVLTPEEFDRFLKSSSVQVRRVCLAAVHTALRLKDLKLLTRDNVNESTNQLEGVQAKTGKPYEVPITGVMRQLIETSAGHEIFDFTNFRKHFDEARKRAGLDFEFRDLRRTAARMMLQKGVDLATVSSYLGHSTIAMTEAYVQAKRENRQIAGEILGSVYRPPEPESPGKVSEKVSESENVLKLDLVTNTEVYQRVLPR